MGRIKGLAIGTRYFDKKGDSAPQTIVDLAKNASAMADVVIIAVNAAKDKSGAMTALKKLKLSNLTVIKVEPWLFVQPMNAIVDAAANRGMKYLMSYSSDVTITEKGIQVLMNHMADDTLCVGAMLKESHDFVPTDGPFEATGKTVPWNTCCLWNMERFSLVGFPLVGDAPFDYTRERAKAGIEEISAIALMQNLYGVEQNKAKLVDVPEPEVLWKRCDDPDQKKKHEEKIASKDKRAAEQLRRLGLSIPPHVLHVS
jgi:hypothetical protein